MSSALWGRLKSGIGGDAMVAMAIRGVGLALGFASHILLSRLLGPEDYGRYAIVLGWALIFVIPTRLGLDTSALKFAAHYHHGNDDVRLSAFQRYSILTMAVGAAFWGGVGVLGALVSAWRSHSPVQWAEAAAFGAMLFPLAAIGYFSAFLRATGRIAASQVYEQVLRPVLLIAGILSIFWQTGVLGLNGALLVTVSSLWLILLLVLVQSHEQRSTSGGAGTLDDRRTWLRTGGTLLAISATQELMNQVDVILLGWAGLPQQAALFSAASRLASLVVFGLVAVGMIAASPIAVAHGQGDRAAMAGIARQAARIASLFAVAIAIIINAMGGFLLGLFGHEFVAAVPALAILTIGGVVNAATGVVAYLLSMTGNEKSFLVVVAVSLCVNVLLNLLLVPSMGAVGAAIAATAGLSTLNILTALVAKVRTGINGTVFAWGRP